MKKVILLTGATDGIGLATAKLLAADGHQLLLHGRNPQKLTSVIEQLSVDYPDCKIEGFTADLSDFGQIHQLAHALKDKHDAIDVIINNAGIFKVRDSVTTDGLDVRFVVNTFAPFILTNQLLPLLSENGRIVNLSSAAQAPVDLSAMTGDVTISNDFSAYAQSKLAITMWSQEMAKTLKPAQVTVAVNPGSMLGSKMVQEGFGVSGGDLTIGASILKRAALSDEFSEASGKYFDNDSGGFALPHGDAQDEDICRNVVKRIEQISLQFEQQAD